MPANLLERDEFVLELEDLLRQAAGGHGRIALVSGEAGIGKTSLVESFLEQQPPEARTLWGACEALFTPRPLGPLYDIAQQTTAPLRALLDGEVNRATLFAAVLDELAQGPAPTIVIFEDIHWADEATLDLIKYLARRIHRTPALLILTYRDDELTKDHPLRLVLGDLPARDVARLWLPPLSEAAVAALARTTMRLAKDLYAVTGGNPFFVAEVLASAASGAPTTVYDAVLARMARLSPAACRLLDLVSVVPNRMEWWVVEVVSAEAGTALEECLAASMLQLDGGAVGFRHELARQAVESALSPTRRKSLHAQVLRTLLERDDEQVLLARLVHHATQAEDGALVVRFAPAAARQASAQGAHREAAAYYGTALRFADRLEADTRAELLEGLAYESVLIGQMPEAVQADEDAIALWQTLERPERIGHNLRWLARTYWYMGRKAEADHYIEAAVQLLQTLPPGSELAWAYNYRAMFAMLADETVDAQLWANRALDVAERLGDDEALVHATNTLGMARLYAGDQQGLDQLHQSLQLALERGYEEHVGRAYSNLSCYFVRFRDYAHASNYIAKGIAYCADRDIDVYAYQLLSWRALAALEQGDWMLATEDADAVIGARRVAPINKIQALVVLGWVRMRRGDPGVETLLDEARDLALSTGELQRIAPVMAARAESAWLRADFVQCAVEARVGFDLACAHGNPWPLGQLAFWLWRAGALTQAPLDAAAPYASQIAGDWQAAAAWEQIGCPYEQALALMDGDEAAQQRALAIFERLGAAPAADLVRRRLRSAGVRGLPRGPRSATRANPQGLTNRQLEILLLLAEGLHNAEIAERLSTTPKTVEHHVSAVLAKLEARSRAEAVRRAYQLGLVTQAAQRAAPFSSGV